MNASGKVRDETVPDGKWKFDAEVADSFDDMLERSIPEYSVMRRACFDVGKRFVRPHTHIVDLGCSRGKALMRFAEEFPNVACLGIEVSEPMIESARRVFVDMPHVQIRCHDLRKGIPEYVEASVVLSVLTLQFTPMEYRLQIFRSVFEHLTDGGVFILVEKVLGAGAELDSLMVDLYYDMKRENGYTEEQIQRKRLSLEGVLVPVTAHMNEEMLRLAGFQEVDCFWRWMNFAGWLAIKKNRSAA